MMCKQLIKMDKLCGPIRLKWKNKNTYKGIISLKSFSAMYIWHDIDI